jgi:hypothetical protein
LPSNKKKDEIESVVFFLTCVLNSTKFWHHSENKTRSGVFGSFRHCGAGRFMGNLPKGSRFGLPTTQEVVEMNPHLNKTKYAAKMLVTVSFCIASKIALANPIVIPPIKVGSANLVPFGMQFKSSSYLPGVTSWPIYVWVKNKGNWAVGKPPSCTTLPSGAPLCNFGSSITVKFGLHTATGFLGQVAPGETKSVLMYSDAYLLAWNCVNVSLNIDTTNSMGQLPQPAAKNDDIATVQLQDLDAPPCVSPFPPPAF